MRHIRRRGFHALLTTILAVGSAGTAHSAPRHAHIALSRHTHRIALHHAASTFRHHMEMEEASAADDLNNGELGQLYASSGFSAGGAIQTDNSAAQQTMSLRETIPDTAQPKMIESGTASWYGKRFSGRVAADGSVFNEHELTAAHRWLPLGSKVRVTLANTNRYVDVTITDRPGTRTRVIDLSKGAAAELGIVSRGTAKVILSQL